MKAQIKTVKERPILMSGEMVRAILDGRKSQTRRVMKRQPDEGWFPHNWGEVHKMKGGQFIMRRGEPVISGWGPGNSMGDEAYSCPYGQPGDRLWVKEAFRHYGNQCSSDSPKKITGSVLYRADNATLQVGSWEDFANAPQEKWWNTGKTPWKPSIFMPRWTSRITLEITGIRVERLQDISEGDAYAEGVTDSWPKSMAYISSFGGRAVINNYAALWKSINGDGSWDLNPWVWVVEFKRVKGLPL